MANITFIDKYIIDGPKEPLSMSKFYDTILCTNRPMAANSNEITNLYRVPLYDTFLRYREQFEPTVMEYDLPQKYFYKPKLVSYEIYQTTEMWIALLRLNKMRNVTEFRKPKIKIYDPDSVTDLIQLFFKREGKIS